MLRCLVTQSVPVFFHEVQLEFKPLYEWAFGERIPHPETTSRAESILGALQVDDGHYAIQSPNSIPEASIKSLHSKDLLTLYETASKLPKGQTFYPSVFPNGEEMHRDPKLIEHAGAYCFDSGTPLNAMTREAASWSAACALEAARVMKSGAIPMAYALSRPPGHHATRDLFGGYSYFNNAAIAAEYLKQFGKVVILDIDFHHGNGTQRLFYNDPDVYFISIHGDPKCFYPYFSGYESEAGEGRGKGFNLNIPLPGQCDGSEYLRTLRERVVPKINAYRPSYLIVSAGHDTYIHDPVGHFALTEDSFISIGEELGRLDYPILVVQEGGYCSSKLGELVHSFLEGMRRNIRPNPRKS